MNIIATLDEQLKMVYDALTTGMPYFVGYGFTLEYSREDYAKARKVLQDETGKGKLSICIEDIQVQMLRMGLPLTFTDHEGDGDGTTVLTTALIERNWHKVPMKTIAAMAGDWDAEDADVFMQYILFGEIVYG